MLLCGLKLKFPFLTRYDGCSCDTSEAAPHGDVLRIRRNPKLRSILATAVIRERTQKLPGSGLIVSVALRVTPLNVPLIIALVVAVTVVVLMLKVADVAPAATVTLGGTKAAPLTTAAN